jgi:hypothetical protein
LHADADHAEPDAIARSYGLCLAGGLRFEQHRPRLHQAGDAKRSCLKKASAEEIVVHVCSLSEGRWNQRVAGSQLTANRTTQRQGAFSRDSA